MLWDRDKKVNEENIELTLEAIASIGLTEESLLTNISPLAPAPNKNDSDVGRLLIQHEATGKAIRLFDKHKKRLTDYAYWFYLSTCWVSYSGFSDLNLWRQLFSSSRPNRKLSIMKPSEVVAYELLPDEFVIYRAKRDGEKDWIAYTLNPETAAKMALQRKVSVIHQYKVKKKEVLALFLRRGEAEVIILDKSKPELLDVIQVNIED